MDHLDSNQVTYLSIINHGRETEILRFRTYVLGSNPHGDNKVFLYNLVKMYWTLNSIYMQFECQYPKSRNISVDHVQLPREMLRSFVARRMYCLKFGFFVARRMYCLK